MRYEVSPKYRRAPFASVSNDFIEEESPTPRFWVEWPDAVADDSPEALRRADKMLAQVRANQAARAAVANTEAINDRQSVAGDPGVGTEAHRRKPITEARLAQLREQAARARAIKLAKQAAEREVFGSVTYKPRAKPRKGALVKGSPEAKARMAAIRERSPYGKPGQGPRSKREEHNILASPDVTAHVEQQLVKEGFSLDAIRKSIREWGKLVR